MIIEFDDREWETEWDTECENSSDGAHCNCWYNASTCCYCEKEFGECQHYLGKI